MVHVADIASTLDFYQAVGAQVVHGSRDGDIARCSASATRS
jgi:hypothetical protein